MALGTLGGEGTKEGLKFWLILTKGAQPSASGSPVRGRAQPRRGAASSPVTV